MSYACRDALERVPCVAAALAHPPVPTHIILLTLYHFKPPLSLSYQAYTYIHTYTHTYIHTYVYAYMLDNYSCLGGWSFLTVTWKVAQCRSCHLPSHTPCVISHLSCFNAAGCLITGASMPLLQGASMPLLQGVAVPCSCSYLYWAVLL